MMDQVKVGSLTGTGAIANIELGFIPSAFQIFNITDGDVFHTWFKGMTDGYAFKATNHDTTQLSTITTGGISDFAGEAPGKILTGTFAISDGGTTVTGTNSLALTELKAGDVIMIGDQEFTVDAIASATSFTVTEAADGAESGAAGIRKTGRAEGVTLAAAVAEADKVLRYIAFR